MLVLCIFLLYEFKTYFARLLFLLLVDDKRLAWHAYNLQCAGNVAISDLSRLYIVEVYFWPTFNRNTPISDWSLLTNTVFARRFKRFDELCLACAWVSDNYYLKLAGGNQRVLSISCGFPSWIHHFVVHFHLLQFAILFIIQPFKVILQFRYR